MIENTGTPRARRIATATERLPLNHRTMRSSDGRFHIPDEGAEAELVGPLIEGAKGLQQTGDEVGVNDGQDGLVHRRPSVRPEVWIARLGAASGDLSKSRVAAAVEVGQQCENVFVMGLIAGYKYSFHKGSIFGLRDEVLVGLIEVVHLTRTAQLAALALDAHAGKRAVEHGH